MNGRLRESYKQKDTQATFSAAYMPLQNGTVERANRTINEGVSALLLGGDMEDRFWVEAARALLYEKTLFPRIQLQGKCPYELFTGHAKPSLPEFAFGQDIVYWQPRVKREKLDPPDQRGRYLGFCYVADCTIPARRTSHLVPSDG